MKELVVIDRFRSISGYVTYLSDITTPINNSIYGNFSAVYNVLDISGAGFFLEMKLSTLKGKQRKANRELAEEFIIQICSTEGRLLSEYTLSRRKNRVTSLNAAERYVRKRLSNQGGAPLIIVISEDTINEFRQTQSQVSSDVTRH